LDCHQLSHLYPAQRIRPWRWSRHVLKKRPLTFHWGCHFMDKSSYQSTKSHENPSLPYNKEHIVITLIADWIWML
jgi:hypothetical protein